MIEREQVEAAKKKVLAVYPSAVRYIFDGGVCILPKKSVAYFDRISGWFDLEESAWLDAASRLPAPAVSQPGEAAQVESGDGLLPTSRKVAITTNAEGHKEVKRIIDQLQSTLSEIERLKGLLRDILEYYPDSFEQEDKNRIKAAVTGE